MSFVIRWCIIKIIMNKKLLKRIASALLIGTVLTLTSLIYVRQTTVTKYNDCVGLCAAWVSREAEATARGLPLPIITTENEVTDDANTTIDIDLKNAFIDWLAFSAIAYIPLHFLRRDPK